MGRCLLHARLDAEQIHLRRTRKKLPHAVSSVQLSREHASRRTAHVRFGSRSEVLYCDDLVRFFSGVRLHRLHIRDVKSVSPNRHTGSSPVVCTGVRASKFIRPAMARRIGTIYAHDSRQRRVVFEGIVNASDDKDGCRQHELPARKVEGLHRSIPCVAAD